MPIEGFDYKNYADNLAKQASDVLKQPGNAVHGSITPRDAKIIADLVKKFCTMAGETLNNDQNSKFNSVEANIIVQFIGEYTFHKYIDMINGKVPEQHRLSIINQVVANIYSTAQLAIIKKMPDDDILRLVSEKVKLVYEAELQKLIKKGVMTEEQYNKAIKMSNLDNMVQQNNDEARIERVQKSGGQINNPNDKKVLKLAALSILLKRLPKDKTETILSSLAPEDVMHIKNYMKMGDIENKIDHKLIIKSLGEIKQIIPEPDTVNVDKLLKHYKKVLKNARLDTLSELAMYERENVKDFILDSRFPASNVFSPFVLQSLVNTIEDKLNDN